MQSLKEPNTVVENEKSITKPVSILIAGHLTVDTYGGFLAPIMPFIAAKLGITIAFASFIYSLSHLTSSILQPLFGHISDGISKRFFVFWGLILASIFMSLTGIASSVFFLAIAVILGSLGVGLYHPQATSQIGHFSGKKINSIMAIFTAAGSLGYALGPIVSSNMVNKWGLESLPWAIFPGIMLAFILYKFLPKIPKIKETTAKVKFKTICKEVCGNSTLIILTIISIVKAMLVLSFIVLMPFLWKELGYSISAIGIAVAMFSGLGGLASFLGGFLANKVGRKNIFYISLLPIFPIAAASMHFVEAIPLLSFALFAFVGFFTMLSISVNIIMAQLCAPTHKGMISGVIGGFSWGVMGVFLTPLGFFAQKFGVTNVLTIVGLMPLLSAFLVKKLPAELD